MINTVTYRNMPQYIPQELVNITSYYYSVALSSILTFHEFVELLTSLFSLQAFPV